MVGQKYMNMQIPCQAQKRFPFRQKLLVSEFDMVVANVSKKQV